MKHKHRRKKKYFSVTDRPVFKISSAVLMTAILAPLYYLVVILMERPELALIVSVPCVFMLVWVAIKQLNFWWIWLLGAVPCVALMVLFPNSVLLETAYWGMSFAMCQWLIWAPSRAKSKSKRRKKMRQQQEHHSHESVEPRPRDELLEKLFAENE